MFLDGEEVWRACSSIDEATNNEAEYRGLLLGLDYVSSLVRRLTASDVRIEGDSELVINQAGGSYKCHSETLRPLLAAVRSHVAALGVPATFAWCSREDNGIADSLAASGVAGHDTVDERRAVLARFVGDERGRGRGRGGAGARRSRSRSRERGGGGGGGGGGGKLCYICGKAGHVRAECSQKHCYACGRLGHVRADCPTPSEDVCDRCYQKGHRRAECRSERVEPEVCDRCFRPGHRRAQCAAPRYAGRHFL